MNNSRFFCNKECEYFPCHKTDSPEDFNCLFCYCPLYSMGENCGGNFTYIDNKIKDCSQCEIPHSTKNYNYIIKKLSEIINGDLMVELTKGKITPALIKFSVPLLISVAFQQMYNICDSVIAGKFAGENALAAVGASYPITMIFMAFAVGCNIGSSVIVSQLFGSRKLTRMKTAVNTALVMTLVLSIFLAGVGLVFCDGMLKLLDTPKNIFDDGSAYLGIYTLGLPLLFMYNIASGIFTAIGDSKTPLYLLIFSSVLNIILDLVFVIVFEWGVRGVGWATFIAQGLASILSLIVVFVKIKKI